MGRIKCPHCGAGNRDARETVTCWQCGKQMWEAADRQTYALKDAPNLPGTTALDPNALLPGMAPEPQPAKNQSLLVPILITVLCFILFVAVALWKFMPSSGETPTSTNGQPATSAPQ